jgi:photosystem II stability/assembly factor-like uncharacterized protein
MKIFPLIAAAAVAFVAMPAAASAAPMSAPAPTALVTLAAASQSVRVSIGDQRRHGRRANWRRVCTTKWRNGHRVRQCRRVRGWGRR